MRLFINLPSLSAIKVISSQSINTLPRITPFFDNNKHRFLAAYDWRGTHSPTLCKVPWHTDPGEPLDPLCFMCFNKDTWPWDKPITPFIVQENIHKGQYAVAMSGVTTFFTILYTLLLRKKHVYEWISGFLHYSYMKS